MANSVKQESLKLVAAHCPGYVDHLKAELADKIQSLINLSDMEQLRKAQGYAQCLQNLLNEIEKARRA